MRGSRLHHSNSNHVRGPCYQNPKCCYDTHDLECPTKFDPPLLSTSTEFCTEALAKGIPIPKCVLAKPKKMQIEREAPPLAQPASARHLKNWQKWCYIWRETYNHLTTKRNDPAKPPIMSSGELNDYKKEDKELFERTLHSYHLSGFYVKNAQFPDSIKPTCGGTVEIQEVITKRHLRDFPEMTRHRYPNYIRNEVSVPPRKQPPTKEAKTSNAPHQKMGFNWEERWTKSKHVEKMKKLLKCDIGLYGKTDPNPENLILIGKDGTSAQDKSLVKMHSKDKVKHGHAEFEMTVPQLVFSVEDNDDVGADAMSMTSSERKISHYRELTGPILKIRSQYTEKLMTFPLHTGSGEYTHFIGTASHSFASTADEAINDSLFFFDQDHHFSTTTKCKETQYIVMKNEGTTAIRYQWFRSPPTFDAQQMLQDPTEFKNLRLETDESQQGKDDDTDSNASGGASTPTHQSEANALKRVSKKTHLEFHFCSLPGVVLPGQTLDFPIIFRSKNPGFFHETLYLLTHPQLKCTRDGRSYAVRLSGVCIDVELAEGNNEMWEMEGLKRFLNQKCMEEETMDLMDSILDRALWEATNTTVNGSSLPNGRVTAESIFYAHNKDFYYHFGHSEKAIELTRQLIEMLVPKERLEESQERPCDMSLQSMYNLVLSAKEPTDLDWSQLRSQQCEDLLEKLDSECMLTLSEQRTFAWPYTERRKYTACYSNLMGTFHEILLGFDRLHNLYNSPAMKLIDRKKGEKLVEDYLKKEEQEWELKAMIMSMMLECQEGEGGDEVMEDCLEYFGEAAVNNVPSLTIPQNTPEDVSEANDDEDGMALPVSQVVEEAKDIPNETPPYWLAAFEDMIRPYTRKGPKQQKVEEDLTPTLPASKKRSTKEQTPVKEQISSLEQDSDMEGGNTDTTITTTTAGVVGGGDAPPIATYSTPASRRASRISFKEEVTVSTGLIPVPLSYSTTTPTPGTRRESTAPTLQEAMAKQVENERRQVLTEARVKLFEDLLCEGIERMLETVDSFNNMLDYRDSDALVVIDDKC